MDYTYDKILLTDVIDIDILLKWNLEYPPSLLEKKQNNIINKYQGNKNIFIDNYKLLDFIYNI